MFVNFLKGGGGKGFTMVELVIGMGVLATISVAGFAYFQGFSTSKSLTTEAYRMVSVLRAAQIRAVNQDQSSAWGVRFNNTGEGELHHYETFYGADYGSGTISDVHNLSQSLTFLDPTSLNIKDVIFSQGTGYVTPATITVALLNNPSERENIIINEFGMVNFDGEVIVDQAPPSSPLNLTASLVEQDQAYLTWEAPANDNGSSVTNYNVYRGTTPGSLNFLAALEIVFEFTDSNLSQATDYYYAVTAVNSGGEGDKSSEVSVSTPAGVYTSDRYAWGESVGWIDFGSEDGNVMVNSSELTGYAWGENVGWVSLNCSNTDTCGTVNYKVSNDGAGALSGHAWSESVGWINFGTFEDSVTIDADGYFHGYAWGENVGWISFNCNNTGTCGEVDFKVRTHWRP